MTSEEYRKIRLEKKIRKRNHRNFNGAGMGIAVPDSPADSVRYPRIRSARKFIKMGDGVSCVTFRYDVFNISGYACKKVMCVHREPPSILERCLDRICQRNR